MCTLTPLQRRYDEVYSHLQQDRPLVGSLFYNVLRIPDCSWGHVTDELNALRCKDFSDYDVIYEFYNYLNGLLEKIEEDDYEEIRSVKLILNHSIQRT